MEELPRGSWRIGQCFLLDHNRPIAVEIACVLIQRELESGNARLAILIDKWLDGASNRLRFSLSRRTQYCWREIAPLENISQSNIPLFRWFEMSLFRNFAGTKYRLNRAIMPYSSRWEFKDRCSRWGLEPAILPLRRRPADHLLNHSKNTDNPPGSVEEMVVHVLGYNYLMMTMSDTYILSRTPLAVRFLATVVVPVVIDVYLGCSLLGVVTYRWPTVCSYSSSQVGK